MGKHTAGPWTIEERSRKYGNKKGVLYPSMIVVADTPMISTMVCELGIQTEEREANARLIAAAPELLDALKQVVAIATSPGLKAYFDGKDPEECSFVRDSILKAIPDYARDALAKVHGHD